MRNRTATKGGTLSRRAFQDNPASTNDHWSFCERQLPVYIGTLWTAQLKRLVCIEHLSVRRTIWQNFVGTVAVDALGMGLAALDCSGLCSQPLSMSLRR